MSTKKVRKKILYYLGLTVLSSLINFLMKTVKIRYKNYSTIEKFKSEKQNFVSAFWHGTMLTGWYIHKDTNIAALVSKSKDGDILEKLLGRWGYKVVRGSSSNGGKEALLLLLELAENGYSIAITPDGPKGPPYKMKAGAVITAKTKKIPLILAGISCCKKKVLKSWDNFEVPYPFSIINVVFSEPIWIDSKLNYEETNKLITDCEIKLNKLRKEASKLCSE
ncbi:lysophospholipid acyltransferase family protein [Melioribacteraceae bacterium 4301-Me]|uniref:lysophospholipid acyltransferase family protein n=1 Tax=Pyranulibacter aquaticus TaxID=3163344 RepID=UPI003597D0D1